MDNAPNEDSGAQRQECTDKVSACIDRCNEIDLGLNCRLCCESNGRSCDVHQDYSFSSCLDAKP